MGIKSETINKIKELTASVSGSSARLITNTNFKLLSQALVDIIDELDIDTSNSVSITNAVLSGTLYSALGIDVNGGKFTVNGMGQVFAQGGIYTPLAHISRLRLDPDPTTVAIQAGEIRWSGSDFLGWNGATWESFTGGNYGPGVNAVTITAVTHSQLVNLMNTSSLEPGSFYRITDYRTVHYIQFTGNPGNPTPYVGGEQINAGPPEQLIVQASGVDSIYPNAMSEAYPVDSISYWPGSSAIPWNDREYDSVWSGPIQSKGVIFRRYDHQNKNGRDYDFRAFKYRRWETAPGNGVFESVIPVSGSAHVDMSPVGPGEYDNEFGFNQVIANAVLGIPYATDNVVTEGTCTGNRVLIALLQHVPASCSVLGNRVLIFAVNELGANSEVNGNRCSTVAGNTVLAHGKIDENDGSVNGNTALEIQYNQITVENNTAHIIYGNYGSYLYNNNVLGDISENFVGYMTDNTVAGDIQANYSNNITNNNVLQIKGNHVHYINGNNNGGLRSLSWNHGIEISSNSGNRIDNNRVSYITANQGDVINCSGDNFDSNQCSLSHVSVIRAEGLQVADVSECTGVTMVNLAGSASISNVSFEHFVGFSMQRDLRSHIFLAQAIADNTGDPFYPTIEMADGAIPTSSMHDQGGLRHVETRLVNCVPVFRCVTTHARFSVAPFISGALTTYFVNIGPACLSFGLDYDTTGTGMWASLYTSTANPAPGDYSFSVSNPASGTYNIRLSFVDPDGVYHFPQGPVTWP
jgi:hypothetical protein